MAEAAQQQGHEVICPAHADCDLLHPSAAAAAVLASRAGIVINCAAISGLEACADDAAAAHTLNAEAPAAMARACRETGARFIHLSTDYVLCGNEPGLKGEDAPCRPICEYGRSKLAGEQQVSAANPESLVLRVSWLCGNPARPGFPESIAMKALAGQPLAAIDDKVSLPTDVNELAAAALQLAAMRVRGLLHVCSTGDPVSWWQNAHTALQTLVQEGALPRLPEIAAQKLDEVPFFREPRPRHTAMDNARLRALGITMSGAEATIRNAVRRWLVRPSS